MSLDSGDISCVPVLTINASAFMIWPKKLTLLGANFLQLSSKYLFIGSMINPMMIHVFVSKIYHQCDSHDYCGCCLASEKWYHITSGFPIRNPSGKIPEIMQEEESLVSDYR